MDGWMEGRGREGVYSLLALSNPESGQQKRTQAEKVMKAAKALCIVGIPNSDFN